MKRINNRKKLYKKRVLMECVMMVLMLCGCSDHTVDNPFSKDTGYQVEMEVDGAEAKVITAGDIEVQNITENLKRTFEEELRIEK